MKDKAILHCDINHCFAQFEEMMNPELKNVPMCVGGDEEKRNGIVLARNLEAKKFGVKTAEPLRAAFQKCPHLVVVPPRYREYVYYSEKIKDIYREYTDEVESFGVDEAWVDVTHSQMLFGSAVEIGRTIQNRVKDEWGITISVGVSFNKIFSKLGSDFQKPSGFTVITKENFKEVVWPLLVEDLLHVGIKTLPKLQKLGIFTIGDLARYDLKKLQSKLGKSGLYIWSFANGLDDKEVNPVVPLPKSVGNGITPPRNMNTISEVKEVLYVLTESVAARLKEQGLSGTTVSVALRNTDLEITSRQKTMNMPTNLVPDIMEVAQRLLQTEFDFEPPYRSVTITVSNLVLEKEFYQTDIFNDPNEKAEIYRLETTIEHIRGKFGFKKIKRASLLLNEDLTDFDPKGDHTIHPVGYFR